ncbi:MAG: HEAT repeat domain-containing protein [Anaerolineales bacterium]|nr:HEAT repeat domain-containing protein [Anaerolineales bacterium]
MPATPEFSRVLARLRDAEHPVSMSSLYQLSDLAGADLEALEGAWAELPVERRRNILADLNEIGEANFEVTFESIFRLALEDEDAEVRATAIRALWETEDATLIAPLLQFLAHDPDVQVRAAAGSGLGRFVYLGEVEELPTAQARRVEEALLNVVGGADALEVRRRALEAVAYASRPEVAPLIEAAYASSEPRLRVSAVFAMGRTAEAKWGPRVLAELNSPEPEMRYEAVRAAGELELRDAGPNLARLVSDPDTQVREAAIWSLGQIGGELARKTLKQLRRRVTDEDERDFIDEAIDNLAFSDEVRALAAAEGEVAAADDEAFLSGLMRFDDDEDDEDDEADDLDDLDLDDLDFDDGLDDDEDAEA